MRNKLTYILLTLLLLVAHRAIGQEYEIDKVCLGAERHYRIDGETGSTYAWQLTVDPLTAPFITLPETGDAVTITWDDPTIQATGRYYLINIQYGVNGCDTTQMGYIDVFELPGAYAGEDLTLCSPAPLLLSTATATDYSALLWTASGDGFFDDDTQLNPTYTFGANDIAAGSVTLTLTATGLGNDGSCPPAESSITITLSNLLATTDIIPASCNGAADGSVAFTASGGTAPYTYVLDGVSNTTGLFTDLAAGTYAYTITDATMCEINGEITITQPDALLAEETLTHNLCAGGTAGAISLILSGGTEPYAINWIGPDGYTGSGADITSLAAGEYTATITDNNGCELVVSYSITEPEPLVPAITPATAELCLNGTVSLTGNFTGGTGAATSHLWTGDGAAYLDFTDIATPVFTGSIAGTYSLYYTVTDENGCEATSEEALITVNEEILPLFTAVGPYCAGADIPDLPLISENGITGTWTPAINNTVTTEYTFTPDADQCAVETTMTIVITDEITPTFAQIGPLCFGTLAPDLPATSQESINGTWTPATIDMTATGTYTFTPDADQCAVETTMTIVITDEITPTFAQIGPLCFGTLAPDLPATSQEGITGTWTPATIDMTATGTYTFTPDADQCAVETTMTIVITDEITPTFAQIGPLCFGTLAPDLPATSQESINGTWTPATIDMTATGTYTFTPDADQCAVETTMTIVITDEITPTFAQIGPLCFGTDAPDLPATSQEGITGTWTPATIDMTATGTYTFTPDADQCAVETTMTIVITDEITPTFAQIGPLCFGTDAPDLPATSQEGINGTWTPATIDMTATGTYTFTPDADQCAVETTMTIVITDEITPTFAQIGPLCFGTDAPDLPATSQEGITGTWTPATIDMTATGTYTFTPDADQCAVETTMTIVITDEITPTFAQIGPLCFGTLAPELPATSQEGINGTWTPATIDMTATGTYTFTPDADQCAVETTMTIVITDEITPTFAQIGPLCFGTLAPELPATSQEGITGTWTPATIDMTATGTYTFTPDADQCAVETTMTIVITDEITPTFAQIGPLCFGTLAPELPATSQEGINGTWTPATIDMTATGTYTFTPDADQCAVETTMTIVITDEITPTFAQIGPLCFGTDAPELPATSQEGINGTWTPATIDMTATGTYTFTPDADQCAVETTMTIVITDEITPTFAQIGPLCFGTLAPELPATSQEGITGTWTPATIDMTATGTYTFTPDADQCAVETTMTIVITDEITPTFAQIGPLCFGTDAPELPATSQEGITGTWTPAVINTSVPGITTYTFTPEAGNCATEATMNIEVGEELLLNITFTNPTTPGGNDGTATATVTGGTPDYTYLWNDPLAQTTQTATDLTQGTYMVTVTDANGCETTGEITLTDPDEPLAVTIEVDNQVSCYGMNDGQATATATGGVQPYSFMWDDGQTTATATGLGPGTYTVTVTDIMANTAIASITITEPAQLLADVTGTNPTTIGGIDGTATVSITGGTPPYAILWNNGMTTPTINGLSAGVYSVTVTDAHDCVATGYIVLADPEPGLTVNILVDNHVSCNGLADGQATAIAANGNEPYTYLWSDGQATATATGLAAGDYTVTVTDADNNTATASVTITQPEALLVTVTGTNPTIVGGNDGTATASVTGGTPDYTYLWNDPLAQTTQTATGLTQGTYMVTVTDANGCETTGEIELTDPGAALAVSLRILSHVSCYGGSDGEAEANVTGGRPPYTYLWSDGQATATATGLMAGTYTLLVTDMEGTEVTASVTITQPTQLAVAVTGTNPTTPGGNDGTATASVTGGTLPYSYLWNNGMTTPSISGLQAGTYSVTITDGNGCITAGQIILTDPGTPLAVSIIVLQQVSCAGGNDAEAEAIASGGSPAYSYLWSNGQTTAIATGLAAGSYTVTVTDADNNTAIASVTITEPQPLTALISGTDPTSPGGNDGTASVSVSGGTPPYNYVWSNGATTPDIGGLAEGIYTVTVTDANNCTVTAQITLIDPVASLSAEARVLQHVSCYGYNDGIAEAIASNGVAPYSFLWSDPLHQTTSVATGLTEGVYTVIITDALGASASATIYIGQPEELIVNVTGTNPTTPGGNDGTATATSTGGTLPHNYLWSNGQTTATISGLTAGTYTVTVTDEHLCTASRSITLFDPAPELTVVALVVNHVTCFGGDNGEAEAIVTGGIAPYTYLWSNGQSNDHAVNLTAGSYTVTVTDAAGTTASAFVDIEESPEITAIAEATPAHCDEANGALTVTATGGTGNFEYMLEGTGLWQTSNEFNHLAAGIYTVMIRDMAGCEISLTDIGIQNIAGPEIVDINTTNASGGLSNGAAEIIANGDAQPLEYSLDGVNWQPSNSFSNLNVGTHTAYVRDANGCITTQLFIIMQTVDGVVEVSAENLTYCLNLPVIIPVDAKDFTGVASFIIELEFDPDLLSFTELINENPALNNGTFSIGVNGNTLQIRYSVFDNSVTLPNGEPLFALQFEGLAVGLSDLHWNLLQCNIYSESGEIIPSIFTHGQAELLPVPAVYTDGNGVYCEDDELTLHAGSLDSQTLSYEWTAPSGVTHHEAEWQLSHLGINDNGTFELVATNTQECKTSQIISVVVNPKPRITIGYADTICYGVQLLLDPGSGYTSYLWQDGSTEQTQLAFEEGVYWVQVIDNNNCRGIDTVALIPCNIELLIPNAFTPNGDGLNDTFKPLFSGFEPTAYNMSIYSKWGQLLFSTSDTGTGWDGTVNGVPVGPETFVYVIYYEAPSYVRRATLKSPVVGDVTVLR